jgi:hypothetical protein
MGMWEVGWYVRKWGRPRTHSSRSGGELDLRSGLPTRLCPGPEQVGLCSSRSTTNATITRSGFPKTSRRRWRFSRKRLLTIICWWISSVRSREVWSPARRCRTTWSCSTSRVAIRVRCHSKKCGRCILICNLAASRLGSTSDLFCCSSPQRTSVNNRSE